MWCHLSFQYLLSGDLGRQSTFCSEIFVFNSILGGKFAVTSSLVIKIALFLDPLIVSFRKYNEKAKFLAKIKKISYSTVKIYNFIFSVKQNPLDQTARYIKTYTRFVSLTIKVNLPSNENPIHHGKRFV